MIEISGLTKNFNDRVAVSNLNLSVPAGEIFGFLGPNGAGKTTTVKMITGLLKPTAGRVLIAGRDVARDPIGAKKIMGLVPDEPFVYPKLTGIEYLRFVGELYGVPLSDIAKRAPSLLEMFELVEFGGELVEMLLARHAPKACSGGHASARAEGFDSRRADGRPRPQKRTHRQGDFPKRLARKGVAIFMCTHVLEIAEKLCDRIGIMIAGKMIACGTIDELRATSRGKESGLEDIFLSLTGGSEYAELLRHM